MAEQTDEMSDERKVTSNDGDDRLSVIDEESEDEEEKLSPEELAQMQKQMNVMEVRSLQDQMDVKVAELVKYRKSVNGAALKKYIKLEEDMIALKQFTETSLNGNGADLEKIIVEINKRRIKLTTTTITELRELASNFKRSLYSIISILNKLIPLVDSCDLSEEDLEEIKFDLSRSLQSTVEEAAVTTLFINTLNGMLNKLKSEEKVKMSREEMFTKIEESILWFRITKVFFNIPCDHEYCELVDPGGASRLPPNQK